MLWNKSGPCIKKKNVRPDSLSAVKPLSSVELLKRLALKSTKHFAPACDWAVIRSNFYWKKPHNVDSRIYECNSCNSNPACHCDNEASCKERGIHLILWRDATAANWSSSLGSLSFRIISVMVIFADEPPTPAPSAKFSARAPPPAKRVLKQRFPLTVRPACPCPEHAPRCHYRDEGKLRRFPSQTDGGGKAHLSESGKWGTVLGKLCCPYCVSPLLGFADEKEVIFSGSRVGEIIRREASRRR